MSRRTPNEEKALAWFCQTNDYVPQLSAHPIYFFKHRKSGKEIEKHISAIRREWERWREDNGASKTGRRRSRYGNTL